MFLAFSTTMAVRTCRGQERQRPAAHLTAQESVRAFLQKYVVAPGAGDYKATRYSIALVRLHSERAPEALVYLTGDGWCGTGGCPTLILARDGASWRVVTKVTITWPPIRVLNGTSSGWHNISVWVRGGGIRPGYEAELRFDGKSYPTNPSVPPARPLAGKAMGEVVISSPEEGTPLFP